MEKPVSKMNIFFLKKKRERGEKEKPPEFPVRMLNYPFSQWNGSLSFPSSSKAYWPPQCYPFHCSCSTFFNLSDQRLVNKNHPCFCEEQTNYSRSYDNCKSTLNSLRKRKPSKLTRLLEICHSLMLKKQTFQSLLVWNGSKSLLHSFSFLFCFVIVLQMFAELSLALEYSATALCWFVAYWLWSWGVDVG